MLDWDNREIVIKLLCFYLVQHMLHQIKAQQFYTDLGLYQLCFSAAYAAPNKGTTILDWFRSLSTVLSPTENSGIQGLFQAFEWFSSTFQGRFNFQGLFKKAL